MKLLIKISLLLFILSVSESYAQATISGTVYNEYLEPFPNAKVISALGETRSSLEGEFEIALDKDKLPQILRVSASGHQTEEVKIISLEKTINIILTEDVPIDQIVISATRLPERIIESPVAIELLSFSDVKNTPLDSFYDALAELKSVEVRDLGYAYKSVNTRGFADFSNTRFVQLIDGVDSAVPSLAYNQGNLVEVSELDISNVEILPGASSALYGANAYNGLMLMKTKNPFESPGVSALVKTGVSQQKNAGTNPFYDISVRGAHKINDAFAAKVNFGYLTGEEWYATDYRNAETTTREIIEGTKNTSKIYDGINLYGDEFGFHDRIVGGGYKRTGYRELDLIKDKKYKNFRFSGALHYRPLKNDKLELKIGTRGTLGNRIVQGGLRRYVQKKYSFIQNMFEVKREDFFARVYHTKNNAGDSYDLAKTGQLLNKKLISDKDWANLMYYLIEDKGFSIEEAKKEADLYSLNTSNKNTQPNQYFKNFLDDYVANFTLDQNDAEKTLADLTSLINNKPSFDKAFNEIINTPIYKGGSKFYDKSSYFHAEGNYNFKRLLDNLIDFQIGGAYRKYSPDSKGTFFNDGVEKIKIGEYGFYGQAQKKFFERLKLVGSLRYDKSTNFEGNYSPRIALTYELGEEKNHIFRTSYQTAFRNPSLEEQYTYTLNNRTTVLGTVKDNLEKLDFEGVDIDDDGKPDLILNGEDILNKSVLTKTLKSGKVPVKSDYGKVKPESVKTIDFGYRSLFYLGKSTSLDIGFSTFYSKHKNFLYQQDLNVSLAGTYFPHGQTPISQEVLDKEYDIIEKGFANLKETDETLGNTTFFPDAVNRAKKAMFVNGVQVLDFDAHNNSSYRNFAIITNAKSDVTSYGFSLGANGKFKRYKVGLSYNYMDFDYKDKDYGFEPAFNRPKHIVKLQLGNENIYKNVGFQVDYRWQDKYRWVSPFVKGSVNAVNILDTQVSYTLHSMKSTFKLGGTNLFGKEYQVAPGTGNIGKMYYLSWVINNH